MTSIFKKKGTLEMHKEYNACRRCKCQKNAIYNYVWIFLKTFINLDNLNENTNYKNWFNSKLYMCMWVKKIVLRVTLSLSLTVHPRSSRLLQGKKWNAIWNVPEQRKIWKVISFIYKAVINPYIKIWQIIPKILDCSSISYINLGENSK